MATNPYAAYGGTVASGAGADPYAAYGGGVASAPPAAPQPAPTSAAPTGDDAPGIRGMANRLMDPIEGVGEGVMDSASSLAHIIHAPKAATDFLDKAATPDNDTQKFFKGAEGITEFMMGDEALKGASMAERIPKVAKALEHLKASPDLLNYVSKAAAKGSELAALHPRTAAVLAGAARQAAVGTEQGVAHSQGDLGEGLKEGAIAGVAGGAVEGAVSGVGHLYDAVKMGSKTIDGVEIPTLASQGENASSMASGTTAANTPAVADAQQAAGQQVYQNTAKRAVQQAADRANTLRGATAPIEDTSRLLGPGADAKPQRFDLTMGEPPEATPKPYPKPLANDAGPLPADEVAGAKPFELQPGEDPRYSDDRSDYLARNYHYLTGTKPGSSADAALSGPGVLRTTSPEMAQHVLSRLDEMDRAGALPEYMQEGREALRQQLDMYHMGNTNKYIDGARMAKNVQTFGDAADQLRNQAKPIYDKLDSLSDGKFQSIKEQHEAGQRALEGAETDADLSEAHAQINTANQRFDALFNKYAPQGAGRGDWQAAKSLWHDASTLDRVHNTTEGMFNGISPETAADIKAQGQGGPTRKLDKASTDRLGKLERNETLPRLKQVLGSDGIANLQTVNALLKSPARKEAFKIMGHSAAHLAGYGGGGALLGAAAAKATGNNPYEGGAAGFLAGVAGRNVVRSMATNGRAAKLIEYAARNKVDPKIAGPLIAATLTNATRNDVSIGASTDEANQGAPPQ